MFMNGVLKLESNAAITLLSLTFLSSVLVPMTGTGSSHWVEFSGHNDRDTRPSELADSILSCLRP